MTTAPATSGRPTSQRIQVHRLRGATWVGGRMKGSSPTGAPVSGRTTDAFASSHGKVWSRTSRW